MSEWSDRAAEVAKEKGLELHKPSDNELFVDIDCAADLAVFSRGLGILGDLVLGHSRAPSPSGRANRYHCRVLLTRPVKDEFERLLLQCLLGSDRLHEALSWAAATKGNTGVTVFFEKPEAEF